MSQAEYQLELERINTQAGRTVRIISLILLGITLNLFLLRFNSFQFKLIFSLLFSVLSLLLGLLSCQSFHLFSLLLLKLHLAVFLYFINYCGTCHAYSRADCASEK